MEADPREPALRPHAAVAEAFTFMKKISIHLSQSFEELLAAVLALPPTDPSEASQEGPNDEELKQVLRGLYEAANGRHVETALGLVPIAPPVAPFLKEEPLEVGTQFDFFVEAMSRVIACPSEPSYDAAASNMISSDDGGNAPAVSDAAIDGEAHLSPRFTTHPFRRHLSQNQLSHD